MAGDRAEPSRMILNGLEALPRAAKNSFNAVRLLAALQVAYFHTIAHLQLSPTWGYEWIAQFPGVPIFFAVSGYLVFDSLLRLPTTRDFFRHRATRIYPALLVNIVIIEMLFAIGGGIRFDAVGPLRALFFELVYMITASDEIAAQWAGARAMRSLSGFFQIYPSGVLWTLTVELTFYAIVPLFLFARARRAAASALIVALGFVSIASSGIAQQSVRMSLSVIPYFWMFGIGMLFRLWRPPSWSIMPGAAVALAGFVLTAWSRQLIWLEWKTDPSASALLETGLLCLFVLFLGSSPILKSRALAKFDLSYGLYLYHMLIIATLMNIPSGDRSQWLIAVVLIGGLATGLMSWLIVERRAMRWMRATARNSPPDAIKSHA